MTAIQNNFIQTDAAADSQGSTVSNVDQAGKVLLRDSAEASDQHSQASDSRFFQQLVNSQSSDDADGSTDAHSDMGETNKPVSRDAEMPVNPAFSSVPSSIHSIPALSIAALTSVAATATNHTVSLTPSVSAPVAVSTALVQAVAQPLSVMSLSGGALQSFVISLPGMADISVNAALNGQGVQSLQLRSQDNKQQAWLSGQQPALEKGISDILGRDISVAVNDAAETKQGVSG